MGAELRAEIDLVRDTNKPEQLKEFVDQLVQKAFASGLFIYADADLKFDQLRSQGVDLSQVGQDLSTMLGGGY